MSRVTVLMLGGLSVAALLPSGAFGFAIAGSSSYAIQTSAGHPAAGGSDAPLTDGEPVRLAQAGNELVRLDQLEEEVRKLTGKVEDLRFQLLQAQEDMRKQQDDNEFRFQQLEGGSSSGSAPSQGSGSSPSQGSGQKRGDLRGSPNASGTSTASAQNPPADDIGQILQGQSETGNTDKAQGPGSSDTVASVKPEGAGEMYDLAYNYLLAGDYQLAERSFRQYAQTYPTAKDAPDARYWLGESLYQQQKYADAAEVFLDAQKNDPTNPKAPEMMLKLGMSLAKLDNRDVACTTFREVSKRYPNMSANVKSKLATETKASNC